ncbi:endolytic transglycosylase MltG [Pseudomonas chlororaphis]|uniref:endolytic transglycosylase MltG n=1 Tax=Pseudomonas chlororaphis TaxID=587753 RepID=UPI0006A5CBE9|nr:endolytic transglycosylase MltG [Pseudomonas chlororaphis]AZD01071.1 YceG-like protein [Pseudomonas chlororaphis subsp. chlororaphis]MBM0284121.1 endolytic transglycosylase MltG [Pseudomonas chlororaphis]MDO1505426.1 endolytic transglycosylase MltG [Pseudomonas chlororaphis]ORM50100.1 aminodeoxychorismate lyase [Pseudomonas chlororaphis subsp. chlororaphis]TWR99376.1 endolytic transglycosylase MltG [Pseudomonas chlororaphis subsp. chlororaphis]
MRRKLLLLLETGLVLAGLALGASAWKLNSALEQPLNLTQEQLLDVPAGSTPGGTFNRMEANGVLKDAFWLRLYWRFNMEGQPLHSGEYRMTPGMTAQGLIGVWQRGEVVQYSLTLVEGWTFRQVRAALAKHDKLEQTLNGLSDSEVMEKLGHGGVFPEGRFFPDTYRFVRGMTDAELLEKAYSRLDEVLAKEWNKRSADVPYTEPYQALIMASLVEKETGVPQERGQIAGVFVRRMQVGMLLQTDPTVIYGLGERYNGKLTRALLKEATPYNTYVISGLPPTPIAMVGREAIHAALNPVPGSSLYFVARGDGSHVFSDDLDAHNNAVREFQLKRRADYRSSPAPAGSPAASETPESTPAASPDTGPEAVPQVAPQTSPEEPSQEAPQVSPEVPPQAPLETPVEPEPKSPQ